MKKRGLMDELLTDKEVAAYLKMSPKSGFLTIRQWAKQGKIRHGRAGEYYRFKKEDIDDFIFTAAKKR
ncbi:MAG: helix-turn-helix domain-containing protein [Nitrososphaerales archaeon]